MNKFWPFLFLVVTVGCVAMFFAAPGQPGWWLPKDISSHGHDIDRLFKIILGITGVTFVLVELVMVYFMFKYAAQEGRKGTFIHGHHTAEIVWTAIPAAILLYIAIAQFSTWQNAKFTDRFPKVPVHAQVLAGQFEWRMSYPGADGKLDTKEDNVESVNDLHVVKNKPTIIHLKSRDVLHSFFLPNLRLKQDAVPGMTIPLWFEAKESGNYDLACAELCGWGHYKMKGRLVVHDNQGDFDAWLTKTKKEQEATQ